MTFKPSALPDIPEPVRVVVQGAPMFNNAWVRYCNDDVIIVDIDMHSKYCEVVMSSTGQVGVSANKRSLKLDPTKQRDDLTLLELAPPYNAWEFVGCSQGRYSIVLTFCRPDWMKDHDEPTEPRVPSVA